MHFGKPCEICNRAAEAKTESSSPWRCRECEQPVLSRDAYCIRCSGFSRNHQPPPPHARAKTAWDVEGPKTAEQITAAAERMGLVPLPPARASFPSIEEQVRRVGEILQEDRLYHFEPPAVPAPARESVLTGLRTSPDVPARCPCGQCCSCYHAAAADAAFDALKTELSEGCDIFCNGRLAGLREALAIFERASSRDWALDDIRDLIAKGEP